MQSLVTRFHLFLLAVTSAITGVAFFRIPPDYAFVAHWSGSTADVLWPRDTTLAVSPLIQLVLLVTFFGLGRLLSKNQFAKSQHILDPALTLLMTVVASTQLGLLFMGIGSDLDFVRLTAFGFGGILTVLGVIVFEAERHTYAGIRMPWPVVSDAAWRLVHRSTGVTFGCGGISLLGAAWFNLGIGILVPSFALAAIAPVVVAGVATLLTRDW